MLLKAAQKKTGPLLTLPSKPENGFYLFGNSQSCHFVKSLLVQGHFGRVLILIKLTFGYSSHFLLTDCGKALFDN
jgi:hypothetical protein